MSEITCPNCKGPAVTIRVQYSCTNDHRWGDTVDRTVFDKIESKAKPSSSGMKMPFGKYKGIPIEDLEVGYLSWCLGNLSDLRDELRIEMQNQLDLKSGKGVVREMVKREGTKFTFSKT